MTIFVIILFQKQLCIYQTNKGGVLVKKNMDTVRDFYHGIWATDDGFFIDDIWSFDNIQFEREHHFIQWLFPINTISMSNPLAPTLTREELHELGTDDVIRKNMIKSLSFVCRMYGLELTTKDNYPYVNIVSNFTGYWLTRHNHNYLRCTRILKCLSMMGLNDYAEAFLFRLKALSGVYPYKIPYKTIKFWQEAVYEAEEKERE